MSDWQYHQDGRDRAATLGAFGVLAIIVLIIGFVAAAIADSLAP